ncbi:MAG TPA: DUF1772 domain-containing protein [Yinghuangia sp.]|uniref:hypothetical protein n=1 Tax=Yinghuangia sp. YIM S10712 TaxID=3436930 RepID=UPI002CEC61CA|nr:DUF1772 domain-containing protein [Yinghuangia sp.]
MPINGRIKKWAATSPPPDYSEILQRWDIYNTLRTSTAFVAFILLILLTTRPPDSAALRAERANDGEETVRGAG